MKIFKNQELRTSSRLDDSILNYSSRPESIAIKGKRNIDTTQWKFLKEEKPQKIHSTSQLTPSAEKREQEAKKLERMLNEMKSLEFIKAFTTCLSPESVTKVASILNISIPEEFSLEDSVVEQKQETRKKWTEPKEELSSMEDICDLYKPHESEGAETDANQNAYWNLLHHIEKAEKERKRSDPEAIAYKLVEERLDKIAKEFCRWTSCLILPEDRRKSSDSMIDEEKPMEMAIQPEKLRKLFHIELCQPTLCPYVPFIIREAREMPHQVHEKRKTQKTIVADKITEDKRMKLKQVYYVPPNEWFCHQDKSAETEFTIEEEEFIKSFGFKKFMHFLDKQREEPPKVIEDLRKRHKQQLKKIREERNKQKN